MRTLQLVSIFLFCFGESPLLHAQQQVILRDANGQIEQVTQLDKQDRITSTELFRNGTIQRRSRYDYTPTGELAEEVNTMFDDHEYDLIVQYAYADGQLTNKLIGNNRSGRWSSEAFAYDEHGELTRIDHFRKNGVLTYQTTFDLVYRDSLVMQRVRRKVVEQLDSLHADWENEVAIGQDAVPEAGEVKSAFAKTTYAYDSSGREILAEERNHAGTLILSTQTNYKAQGAKRVVTNFYNDDGSLSFSETVDLDQLARPVRRNLGGQVTRYEYLRDTHVVVRTP